MDAKINRGVNRSPIHGNNFVDGAERNSPVVMFDGLIHFFYKGTDGEVGDVGRWGGGSDGVLLLLIYNFRIIIFD